MLTGSQIQQIFHILCLHLSRQSINSITVEFDSIKSKVVYENYDAGLLNVRQII